MFSAAAIGQVPLSIPNPGFESGATGWSNATVGDWEYYAPPEGTQYANRNPADGETTQLTGHIISAGETYTLTVWARSIYSDSHTLKLQGSEWDYPSTGNPDTAAAEVELFYDSTTIASVNRTVNPQALSGAPATIPNDDGANIWLDDGYRMEFGARNPFYQLESADPIQGPWNEQNDADYEFDLALGPIITPQGLKAIYQTYYEDADPFYSAISIKHASGSPPDYNWSGESTILSHEPTDTPWVIDAHLYYDEASSRLWMSWGGLPFRVSEMDPSDGDLIDHPASPEFDTHPAWYHTSLANWSGDEWTGENEWAEGPSLFKHNGYWYLFGSYGNLGNNYTIRMGRGSSPQGPFYDKEGVDMMAWDSSENEYGNSFLLGDDADQLVPGHPHIWEESGKYYLGYDYRTEKDASVEFDFMGIRRLYWVNDWPTIWTPITVTFNADDHPGAIGRELGIALSNVGDSSTYVGFDHVSLAVEVEQPLSIAYVNFNYSGGEVGSSSHPFSRLEDALAAAENGGTIRIAAGESDESLAIDQAVRLEADGGAVRIGVTGGSGAPMEQTDQPHGPTGIDHWMLYK